MAADLVRNSWALGLGRLKSVGRGPVGSLPLRRPYQAVGRGPPSLRNASVSDLAPFTSAPSMEMELGGGGGGGVGGAATRARLSSDASAAAGEDRLSALPNDVLVLILLKLSTTAAARTSVLSRSWRRIWALLPALHFGEPPEPHRLRDVLDAHEVPIGDLRVSADGATPRSIGVWLPAAARRVSGNLTLRTSEDCDDAPRKWGAFEFPCFEKATSVSLFMSFHGLAMPPAGVFARLTDLHLHRVWFHSQVDLSDAVSSPRCPCLQRLTIDDAHGLGRLAIHSESLLQIELRSLHALTQLTLVAPALNELAVSMCFQNSRADLSAPQVANISAPRLEKLGWSDKYDPSSVHLGKMAHLRWLCTDFCIVYGLDVFLDNRSCLSLLQHFELLETLSLMLIYMPDIKDFRYMMEDMTVLPHITFLSLGVVAHGHAFGAGAFHVLRLCTGIRRLRLYLAAPVSEAQTLCSSDCICNHPVDWETEELLLDHLEEVEILGWRGFAHEVAFVKRLFKWGTNLKEMTVTFYYPTSEVKAKDAKELYQIFQSFSRPGVCMKFYLYQNSRKVLYAPETSTPGWSV